MRDAEDNPESRFRGFPQLHRFRAVVASEELLPAEDHPPHHQQVHEGTFPVVRLHNDDRRRRLVAIWHPYECSKLLERDGLS